MRSAKSLFNEYYPKTDPVINRDPEILGGTPVFTGTRVPIRILFEHLEAGDSLDVFLDDFPTVRRDQATELLAYLKSHIDEIGDETAA